MSAHRLSARLASASLSPKQLFAFIDELAPLLSDAALRVAEEHAARLVEQPEWVLSKVLLSPDLAPHILAQLPTTDHAVKGTCRAWRRGWKETLKKRERPRLVVIGGQDNDREFVNSLERYDPSTNEWEEEEAVAPMPTARISVRTVVLDGKLYAAGGWRDAVAASNVVERYDLATTTWEEVAPMASARYAHSMAVLDGKLYAVGGYNNNGDDSYLSSVERYDPALDAWEAVAPMAERRHSHAVAVLDAKLYAVGGIHDDEVNSVERYDPATNAWEIVAPISLLRQGPAVAVLDGRLYAVGGADVGGSNDNFSSVERYDPATNVWEAVAPMTMARFVPGVAALCGTLYVFGGVSVDNVGPTNTVEQYDPVANAWEAVAPMTTAWRCPVGLLM